MDGEKNSDREKELTSEKSKEEIVAPVRIKTSKEVANMKLHCVSPDRELIVYPKWLCFYSDQQFKSPQYVKLYIENRESYKIAYTIKAREKIFRIESSYGILEPKQRRVINFYLLAADDWPLAVNEYAQRRLKVAVESLKIPREVEPVNAEEEKKIAKSIWKRSFNEWPLERLYSKISVTMIPTGRPPSPPVAPTSPPPPALDPALVSINPVSLKNLI